mgnify:CR=1 FL=1
MIELEIDARQLDAAIAELVRRIENPRQPVSEFGARVVRTWVRRMSRTPGHEPSAPGAPPAVQSGHLRGSLTYEVGWDGLSVEMGSPEPYAGVQHRGGTIRPRRRRALTVPISPRSYGRRARDFRGLFKVPARSGDPDTLGVLAVREGRRLVPLFVLRRQVRLPARPWAIIYPEDVDYLAARLRRHLELQTGGGAR